jgi:hypothetical protein
MKLLCVHTLLLSLENMANARMALLGGGDVCTDDEEDSIQIQEIGMDDLNVDILNGHENDDIVNEITVLDASQAADSLDFHASEEMVDGLGSESDYILNVGVGDSTTTIPSGPSSDIPEVPETDSDLTASGVTASNKKQKGFKMKKTAAKGMFRVSSTGGSSIPGMGIGAGDACSNQPVREPVASVRKWERKKIQIKTLEGEFSAFVWVTGRYY